MIKNQLRGYYIFNFNFITLFSNSNINIQLIENFELTDFFYKYADFNGKYFLIIN
jgi:hypothetical protein